MRNNNSTANINAAKKYYAVRGNFMVDMSVVVY